MNAVAQFSASLLSRERRDALPVAYTARGAIDAAQFGAKVAGLAEAIRRREAHSWGICCADAYHFLCALLAVMSCGKRAVIPPNFQEGTLASMRADVSDWIADGAVPGGSSLNAADEFSGDAHAPASIGPDVVLDLFTSGTTGAPKRIRKRFAELAAEVDVLERTWGGRLGSATVVATVPHHHIYGLLFRLLWPLHGGRPFDAQASGDPNELVQRVNRYARAVVISSPAQLGRLPDLTDPKRLLPHAAMIFSSGGPLPPKAAQVFAAAFGEAPTEVYGSSETGGIGWRVQTADGDSDRWTPLACVDVRRGDDGALHVRSPFANANDWFATSDAVDIGGDGRFRLLGRMDRVVKVEEKRLSLPEMEQRLRAYPIVADAGVVLLEGARRVLGAVLVLTPAGGERLAHLGKPAFVRDVRAYLAGYYEPTLLPRRWRIALQMPHDERGKLSAQALAKLFVDVAEEE